MFDVVACLVAFGTAFDAETPEAKAISEVIAVLLATCPPEMRGEAMAYAFKMAPPLLYALERQTERRVLGGAKAPEGNAN